MSEHTLSATAQALLRDLSLSGATLRLPDEVFLAWKQRLAGLPDTARRLVGRDLLAMALRMQKSGDPRLKAAHQQLLVLGLRSSSPDAPAANLDRNRAARSAARLLGTNPPTLPQQASDGASPLFALRARR